jgi:hypothetical protein
MQETATLLYLVATDEGQDPAYNASREAGLEMASRDGAAVLLYDRSPESALTDPFPVGAASPTEDALSEDSQLDPKTLDSLGRAVIADQVREARQLGLQVHAYLAQGTGAEALGDCVSRVSPDLLILPAEVADRASLADRLRHKTLEDLRQQSPAKIKLVSSDGIISDA